MATIPPFLLVHTVQVEAWLGPVGGWATYGPAVPMACLIDEAPGGGGRAGGLGSPSITLYAAPDAVCPAGSRVTLPDGRRGFASAVAARDGGGLPTPDHLEVKVTIGVVVGVPAGETVTLLRRTASVDQDRYGNTLYTVTEVPVPGAAVTFVASAEGGQAQRADTVTDTAEVVLPPGLAVTGVDRLRIRGLVYEVSGRPLSLLDPTTGADAGQRVTAVRVTG